MMKKDIIRLIIVLLIFPFTQVDLFAQNQLTRTGIITIVTETPLFAIEGVNNNVASVLNTETGEIVSSTLIRSFSFKETVFEERFNDNYLESHEFPQATFIGKIIDYKNFDFSKDGDYNIMIEGKLKIHGVTNYIKEKGTITIIDGFIVAKSEFAISLNAYKIELESIYKSAINDEALLKMKFNYMPYSN